MLFPGGVVALIFCLTLATPDLSQSADVLEHLRLLALAPDAGQAVVYWPDGHMLLVRVGEALGSTGVRVLQVLPDRLVLEEVVPAPGQPPIRQQAWLYRQPPAGGTAPLRRLHRAVPTSEQPLFTGYRAVTGPER